VRLLNIARAAELLEVQYDTIACAVEGELIEHVTFEGSGGKTHRLIPATALERYRRLLLERYKTYANSLYQGKVAKLERVKIIQEN